MEEYESRKSKSPLAWIGFAIMTVAAGTLGYLYNGQKELAGQKEITITEKVRQLVTTQTKLDSVSTVLNARIEEVKMLGGKVDDLLKVKARLEADKVAIRNSAKVDIGKYDAKIKEYEQFLTTKDADIAKIKEENQLLLTSNSNLTSENTTLKTDKDVLTKDKVALKDTVVTVVAKNHELSDKVTIGASLRAINVRVVAVNKNGKEKEDESYKGKRVDKIKVVFNLLDNPLTKQEDKEIVMRILTPENEVISHDAMASKFNWKGESLAYTSKDLVAYQNNNQMVAFTYDNSEVFKPGKYSVELYSEGFKIGATNFVIR